MIIHSNERLLSKAGEHLVCADLIIQGFNVFFADIGLAYDLIVDLGAGRLKRLQVKTTGLMISTKKQKDIYRFGTRRGKRSGHRLALDDFDYYAFVALPVRKIAYLNRDEMLTRDGQIKQTIEFKTRDLIYAGRVYSNGTVRTPERGKYLEDYKDFRP